jgi:hypothetical protein
MNFDQQAMWNRLKGETGNYYETAVESEREEFRRFVKSLLHEGPVLVEFTKSDGTIRVMNCTLNTTLGAVFKQTQIDENQVSSLKPKKVNNDACAVWDLDNSQWRSFRWDRLKRIEYKVG